MGEITKQKTANHEEWKALRSKYIGGSDSAAVVGLNPFSSPYALWAEKTGRMPGFEGNLATEVGTYLEEFVAQKFAEETGKKVRRVNQSFFNSDYPWAIANIDREIVGEDAGLEIKTTSELNLKKFKGGEFPENYYVQCVHYLSVTGKKRWYLAVLIGNSDFKIYQMTRIAGDVCPEWCENSLYIDEAEISALMTAERDFWELVKTDKPPAVDGSQATTKAITTIYTESNENAVDLFGQMPDLVQYIAIQNQIKELEKQQEEHANRIKAFMGSSVTGHVARFNVSWKHQTKKTFDTKAFATKNPDIDLTPYYKETVGRVFRVKEVMGE